ncbi:MAG: hypothetical protein ACI4MI_04685 [Christensenellales bacterium]
MKKNKFKKIKSNKMTEAQMREQIQKYSKMSRKELMEQMYILAEQGKASGELDNQQLEEFYQQASPMLNNQQRNELKGLVNEIKD